MDWSSTTLTNPPDEIGCLVDLLYLDLSSNWDLMVLPNSIVMLVKLQTLDLPRIGLKELPSTIGSLAKLEIFYLSIATKLKVFPNDALWFFVNLRIMDLHPTKVKPLPISICNFHTLIYLKVSQTRFKTMPKVLGSLIRSKDLDFSKTKLCHIPFSIDRLTKLNELHLYGNAIEVLPSSLILLIYLQHLSLSYRRLGCLPNQIGDLVNLH